MVIEAFDDSEAGSGPFRVLWWENTDGLGTLSYRAVLALDDDQAVGSYGFADLDGDLDHDFFFVNPGFVQNKLAWRENTDGAGSFQVAATFYFPFSESWSTVFESGDLDGDGDADLLYATDAELEWFENTDGLGAFSQPPNAVNTSTPAYVSAITVVDIDGDGNLDVAVSRHHGVGSASELAWYANPGTDPGNPDSDGDGYLDGAEVAAGSDPKDPMSAPASLVPVLGWLGRAGLMGALLCGFATRSRSSFGRPANVTPPACA